MCFVNEILRIIWEVINIQCSGKQYSGTSKDREICALYKFGKFLEGLYYSQFIERMCGQYKQLHKPVNVIGYF